MKALFTALFIQCGDECRKYAIVKWAVHEASTKFMRRSRTEKTSLVEKPYSDTPSTLHGDAAVSPLTFSPNESVLERICMSTVSRFRTCSIYPGSVTYAERTPTMGALISPLPRTL